MGLLTKGYPVFFSKQSNFTLSETIHADVSAEVCRDVSRLLPVSVSQSLKETQ